MDTNVLYILIGVIVLLNLAFFIIFIKMNKSKPEVKESIPNHAYNHGTHADEDAKTVAMNEAKQAVMDDPTVVISPVKEDIQEAKEQVHFAVDETVVLQPLTTEEPAVRVEKETKTIHYKQADQSETFDWAEDEVLIVGRDPAETDLTLEDSYVGRTHIIIYEKQGNYYLVDLGSKNGTFLDGVRLDGIREIKLGQPFIVGKTEMMIE